MAEKCFCHFNGYQVKDAQARKDISALAVQEDADIARLEKLIKDNPVTPQMFGAIADGVADDTEAIRSAIAAGGSVFFPAGEYLITETIAIEKEIHLFGEGINATVLKYTGTGFMFEISTEYNNPAIIELMTFEGGSGNSFTKCASGSWGACVHMRDFYMIGFNVEWLHLESAFAATFNNGTIRTLGKCVMTTFDGTATTTNFTNRIAFRDCYISNRSTTDAIMPVMFEVFNVRQIEFWNCALEFCDVMFKDFIPSAWESSASYDANAIIAQDIRMDKCWLESVGAVYDFAHNSNAPTADRCRYTRVDKFNENISGKPDRIAGNTNLYFRGGETSTIESAILGGSPVTVDSAVINNPTDSQGSSFVMYKLATNGATWNVPMNSNTVEAFDKTSLSKDLRAIARFSFVSAKFKVLVMFRYSNTAYNIWEAEVFSFNKAYSLIRAEKVYSSPQAEGIGATENVYMSGTGVIKAETSMSAKQIAMVTNFEFNNISKI